MPTHQRNLLKDISTLRQHLHLSAHMPIAVAEVLGLGASGCKQCGYCSYFRPRGVGGDSAMCVCGHYRDDHYRF